MMEVERWGGEGWLLKQRKSKTDTQRICGGEVEMKGSEKNRG